MCFAVVASLIKYIIQVQEEGGNGGENIGECCGWLNHVSSCLRFIWIHINGTKDVKSAVEGLGWGKGVRLWSLKGVNDCLSRGL